MSQIPLGLTDVFLNDIDMKFKPLLSSFCQAMQRTGIRGY